jgi:hypothetical protein
MQHPVHEAMAERPYEGRVDEFDQAEACREGYDRPEVPCCLFASERDALEPLEASALLDASPCLSFSLALCGMTGAMPRALAGSRLALLA